MEDFTVYFIGDRYRQLEWGIYTDNWNAIYIEYLILNAGKWLTLSTEIGPIVSIGIERLVITVMIDYGYYIGIDTDNWNGIDTDYWNGIDTDHWNGTDTEY